MIFPSITEYREALRFDGALKKYSQLVLVTNSKGEPQFSAGNFAVVFQMRDKITGKEYAVKCFTRDQNRRQKSYTLISHNLSTCESPYLVHYEYLTDEVWVNSSMAGNREYPSVIMEWVQSKTLGEKLTELCLKTDRSGIFALACVFDRMALWLMDQPFAHGDLKTDNILIEPNGTLRLIDYDGMYTPEMIGEPARENGSPGFRHPLRSVDHFGPHIDDFSILLISLSLHALAENPNLNGHHNFGDAILLDESALLNPGSGKSWETIENLRYNNEVAYRLVMLYMAVGNPAEMRLFGMKSILKDTAAKSINPFSNHQLITRIENEMLAIQIKNTLIPLPNGKVGQPYNFVFSTEKIGLTEIENFWFADLEPIGLSFNPETDAITGTPKVAGEQSIQLFLKRKGWTEGKPVFERKLTLTVNPDPRSLWQDKLSDKNDPYWKPDSASQFLKVESPGLLLKTERKDVVAASQRGRSHAHEGIFRDDDFGMDYDKNTNWYIITVADGAGSCKASRKGSQIACQTVVNVCKSQLGLGSQHKDFENLIRELNMDRSDANRKKMGDALYGIVGTAVFKAYKNIEAEATKSGREIKDFSTTLIVTVCKKFKFGWFVGAFWVGDGGIGIYNKNTRFLKVLGESDGSKISGQNGSKISGQTRFLTMPEITQPAELYRRLRFDIVDDFTALILMTDGITDPKFETDANLLEIEKWDELWADLSKEVEFKDNNEKSAEQLMKWLDFWSPRNFDDRTIAILF